MNSKLRKLEEIINQINRSRKKTRNNNSASSQLVTHQRNLTESHKTLILAPYFVNSSQEIFKKGNSFNRYNMNTSRKNTLESTRSKQIYIRSDRTVKPSVKKKITLLPTAVMKPICNRE